MDFSTKEELPIAVQAIQMLIGVVILMIKNQPLIMFFQIGETAISWRSKKQTCVVLSTAEADATAVC